MPSRVLSTTQGTFEYLQEGSGPPLVLVHGIEDAPHSWQRIIPEFASSYTTIAIDLVRSTWRPAGLTGFAPEALAELIAGFLNAARIYRATLIGSSLGGLACLRVALSRPERVRALVLADSAGLGREVNPALALSALPVLGEAMALMARTWLGAQLRVLSRLPLLFARASQIPTSWFREQRRQTAVPGFLESSLAMIREDSDSLWQRDVVLDQLRELDVPTQIVWGSEDRMIPLSHGVEAARSIRHSALVVLERCGHLPQVEVPSRFCQTTLPFLRAY